MIEIQVDEVVQFLQDSQIGWGNPKFECVVVRCLQDLVNSQVPSSRKHHHTYPWGNLVHTAEVLDYIQRVGTRMLARDPDEGLRLYANLTTAAILHDWGKIRDYAKDPVTGVWHETDFRNKIRHVAESYALFREASQGLPEADRDEIGRLILAHHGRKEWGSPVEPQTPDALILHQADYWSACYGPNKEKPVDWE